MIQASNPSVSTLRSLVARLHPGSTVRFFVQNTDGSTTEMEMAFTRFSQAHRTTEAGVDKPDGEPSLEVFLRTVRVHNAALQAVSGDQPGKTLKLTEKAVPNSGDQT